MASPVRVVAFALSFETSAESALVVLAIVSKISKDQRGVAPDLILESEEYPRKRIRTKELPPLIAVTREIGIRANTSRVPSRGINNARHNRYRDYPPCWNNSQ